MPIHFLLSILAKIMKKNPIWKYLHVLPGNINEAVTWAPAWLSIVRAQACLYMGLLWVCGLFPPYKNQLLFFQHFIDGELEPGWTQIMPLVVD
jgi:hypothetical protein